MLDGLGVSVDAERGGWVLVVAAAFVVLLWQATRERGAAAEATGLPADKLLTPEGLFWALVVLFAVTRVARPPVVPVPPPTVPMMFPIQAPRPVEEVQAEEAVAPEEVV